VYSTSWLPTVFVTLPVRFVEYWARIGSDDNMTMCHRPTCRREGVLLDYSTDGGAVNNIFTLGIQGLHASML